MKSRGLLFLAFLFATGFLLASLKVQAQAQVVPGKVIITRNEGIVLAPPKLIAPPTVNHAVWSPDGNYLLALQRHIHFTNTISNATAPSTLSIILWDRNTRESKAIWRIFDPGDSYHFAQISWVPETDTALVTLKIANKANPVEISHILIFVDAKIKSGWRIGVLNPGERLDVSPTKPYAIILGQGELRLIRSNGTIAPSAHLPADWQPSYWSGDGGEYTGLIRTDASHIKWLIWDLVAGKYAVTDTRPAILFPAPPHHSIQIQLSSKIVSMGNTKAITHPVWLIGSNSQALVCADGGQFDLSPDEAMLSYISGGALWVMPLIHLPRELAEKLLKDAELRKLAISNAKQINLALMMYLQNNKEIYPPNDADLASLLSPYLQNSGEFSGYGTGGNDFFYLMNGQTVQSIGAPAITIIGYLNAPGGRAVLYADGHVLWENH